MSLRQLPRLNQVNGNRTEKNRRLTQVEPPINQRDAANKQWVEANFTAI